MKSKILILIAFLLYNFNHAWSSGAVFVTGLDTEYGERPYNESHGSISTWCNIVNYLLLNSYSNGQSGILVLGGGKSPTDNMTNFWTQESTCLGRSVTFKNGADPDFSTINFNNYRMVVVVNSVAGSGKLTDFELNIINGRAADFLSFHNDNGAIFASSIHSPSYPEYGFLSSISPIVSADAGENNVTPTAMGSLAGISNTNLDGGPYHVKFTSYAGYDVLATGSNDNAGEARMIGLGLVPLYPTLALEGWPSDECSNCSGGMTVWVGSGNPPYSGIVMPGGATFTNSVSLSNLCTGTYTVTVTDGNNSTSTSTVQIDLIPNACIRTNNLAINTGWNPPGQSNINSPGYVDPKWVVRIVDNALFVPVFTYYNSTWASNPNSYALGYQSQYSPTYANYKREFKTCKNGSICFDLNMMYQDYLCGIYLDGVLITSPSTQTPAANQNDPTNHTAFHNYQFCKYLASGQHSLQILVCSNGGLNGLNVVGSINSTNQAIVSDLSPENCCCKPDNVVNVTACDSYNWIASGSTAVTYTVTGTYTIPGTTADEVLNLTINYSTNSGTTAQACDSYTWASNNNTYIASGTYTTLSINAAGCQHTESLSLTINNSTVVTAPNVSACPGGAVTLGGSPSGGVWDLPNPYTGSATGYTYYYTDTNGCSNYATASIVTNTATITNLNVINIQGLSATATWTAVSGIGWFEIRLRQLGSSTWVTSTASAFNSKALVNLTPNTTYEIQARGYCSLSNVGPWSSSYQFATNNICGIPYGLFTSNISSTSAKLNWSTTGAAFYTIRWKPITSTVWATGTSAVTNKTIVGLSVNTNYEFQVKSNCGSSSSAYSASAYFTTGTSARGMHDLNEMSNEKTVKVYPSPVRNEVMVDYYTEENGITKVNLMDMSGRIVKQMQVESFKGENQIILDVSALSAGVYTLEVFNDDHLLSVERLMKQ